MAGDLRGEFHLNGDFRLKEGILEDDMEFKKLLYLAALVFAGLPTVSLAQAAAVCEGVEGNDPEISAIYVDNFAGWHSVGGEAWLSFGSGDQLVFSVCSVDNDEDYLIAKNAEGNDFNSGKFSRFEWFAENGQLYYCQQVFDAPSAAEAADFTVNPAANTSNANDEGCGTTGQFPWSQLALVRR